MIKPSLVNGIWRVGISVLFIGILARLLHWPYSNALLLGGISLVLIFYPIHFVLKEQKKLLDYSKLILVLFFICHYAFNLFHWPYGTIFRIGTQLAFLLFVILYIKDRYLDKSMSKTTVLETVLYAIAGIAVVLGVLFKILHWPYGEILLITGLISAAVSVIIGSFNLKNK